MRCGGSMRPSSARCVAVPGVRDVAWGSALPLDGQFFGQAFQIDGDPPRPPANRDGAGLSDREPVLLPPARRTRARGTRLHRQPMPPRLRRCASWTKRSCAVISKDAHRSAHDCCVNAMVQPPQAVLREIVGVVKHVKERPDEPEAQPQIYVPIAQNTWWLASLVVQPASGSATALAPAVRAAVARIEPDRPLRVPDAHHDSHAGHVAAPLPRRAGRRVRRAGVDAGARRRLRRARLLGAAADARVRRAHRPRRERVERVAARHLERERRHWQRCRHWPRRSRRS